MSGSPAVEAFDVASGRSISIASSPESALASAPEASAVASAIAPHAAAAEASAIESTVASLGELNFEGPVLELSPVKSKVREVVGV